MITKSSEKPKIVHSESTPNMINIHQVDNIDKKNLATTEVISENNSMEEEEQNSQNTKSFGATGDVSDASSMLSSESDVDLLEYLNKVDYTYRDIKFKIPGTKDHIPEAKKRYMKRVSFDTVNIQFDDDSFDEYDGSNSDEDREGRDGRGRGRRRSRLSSPLVSPLHSPSRSPVRARDPISGRIDSLSNADLSKLLSNYQNIRTSPPYPTTPIITHKGCTLTKVHRDFEKLNSGKLYNKQNQCLSPVLPNRVILVYISGRKHTWVALDWILNKFIEDGDSVVIVSAINSSSITKRRRNSNYTSPEKIIAKTAKMRLRQRNRPEFVKVIAKNIISYAMEVINPDVVAKVSIELAVGKSKIVLQEMYKLYEPNLVVTGAKPSSNISAPLRSWLSSKVTDRLVKNFPLPVIIVPSVNMSPFEKHLRNQVNSRYKGPVDENVEDRPNMLRGRSFSEEASISSNESYSSFAEISETFESFKRSLHDKLDGYAERGYDEKYFSDSLIAVSDKSAEFCWELKGIDPDFRGRGAKLARAITGSNSFGVVPYKTKSLLAPVEAPKPKDPKVPKGPSYKEIKRQLKLKQQQQLQQQQQQQEGSSTSLTKELSLSPKSSVPSVPPPKQTLKFVNLETPKSAAKSNLQTKSNKSRDKNEMKKLQKSFSHDGEATGAKPSRPQLQPLKSHPDLHMTHDGNIQPQQSQKEPKKKSKKFWKLFSSSYSSK